VEEVIWIAALTALEALKGEDPLRVGAGVAA